MPFTPGHPAIILPLIRSRYFSATGLIIGSMSPDFEYFFRMSVMGVHGHTKAGLFYFDVPVTVILALLFHLVVKVNLISNLPPFFQRRFQQTLSLNFLSYLKNHWAIFLMSAAIGAGSHIFWDSFTHNNRFFVRLFSDVYDSTYIAYNGANYPLFYVLQQISTVVGLSVVTVYILLKKPVGGFGPGVPRIGYWLLVFAIAVAVLRLRFYIHPFDYTLGNVVVSGITGLMMGVIFCGFINFRNTVPYQKSVNG
jgi:hypothetical protein